VRVCVCLWERGNKRSRGVWVCGSFLPGTMLLFAASAGVNMLSSFTVSLAVERVRARMQHRLFSAMLELDMEVVGNS
jgi:hypothetical protein